MITRRDMLKTVGLAAAGVGSGLLARPGWSWADEMVTLPIGNGERPLAAYPGKRPLIVLTQRPPQLETPFSVFDENILTPNDAFFVRYHLSDIPLEIDPDTYEIKIGGAVDRPLSISLAELKTGFDPVELVAAHQCSGNSRGFFEPRLAGGQLANGAMGNARWKGVPLNALLERAGVRDKAVEVVFGGLDAPPAPKTPDFAKSLKIDHARDGEVMVAYQMNGEDLPWLNGFPVRLVVPGYYGTYWIKHLNEITVVEEPFENFWMKTAYRIPANACACTEPGKSPTATVPINRFDVRSFITSVLDGGTVAADQDVELRGFAFDGGYGITEVDVSSDGGMTWRRADLGEDLGRYSFRGWKTSIRLSRGQHTLMVRAANRIGQSQPAEPLWNPSGYMRNVIEKTVVQAV